MYIRKGECEEMALMIGGEFLEASEAAFFAADQLHGMHCGSCKQMPGQLLYACITAIYLHYVRLWRSPQREGLGFRR